MNDYSKIHFGVDYYPEHWPEDRWETDAELMESMGVQVVRMAEFSWHKMEPEEGVFDFEWLERIIKILAAHGVKTILGTPTAAPPAWMCNKYPEVLPVNREGIKIGFGGRHHDCQSNPFYREKCRIITTKMAERFGKNENVIGWQIDNELGNSHNDICHCDSCRKAFQGWLEKKYGTVEALNDAWGTAFWSQNYNSFEEVYTPKITVAGMNPSEELDWKCFHSDLIADFAKNESDIIRKLAPDQFITHNYMGFSDLVDYYKLGEQLDFASHDQYPLGYWTEKRYFDPYELAATLDVVRSFKDKPFWIMEQQAGVTGWDTMARLPKPGQLSLWALQDVAHGADCVVFFRWRSCSFGTEEYWHGVLPHSGIPGRNYLELSEMIKAAYPVMETIKGAMPANQVGILYSYRQDYAMTIQAQVRDFHYQDTLMAYYKALYKKNVTADFVNAQGDFSKYKLLIAPLQYLMTPELEEKYMDYVREGGDLVLTMRTGVKDSFNRCMTEMALPGRLSEATGCKVYEYDPLGKENSVAVKTDAKGGSATYWADLVVPDDDKDTFASYDGEFYKDTACITCHTYGKGHCWYVGTLPDEELMDIFMAAALDKAKVTTSHKADAGVEITERKKGDETFVFVINHNDHKSEYEPIKGEVLYGSGKKKLAPFEVRIIKK